MKEEVLCVIDDITHYQIYTKDGSALYLVKHLSELGIHGEIKDAEEPGRVTYEYTYSQKLICKNAIILKNSFGKIQ